jgi:TRAP-type C4-dicarboxylate transport system permease small subunit
MSVLHHHHREGQIAVAIVLVLLAVLFGIAFNWDAIARAGSSMPGLPGDLPAQLILVGMVAVVLLFVYAIFALRSPGISHAYA